MNIQDFSFNNTCVIHSSQSKAKSLFCLFLTLICFSIGRGVPALGGTESLPSPAPTLAPTLNASPAPNAVRGTLVDRLEAIVNKKAIYHSDVQKFRTLTPLRLKVDPLFANDPIAHQSQVSDDEIVNFLVDEALIVEKFPVTDAEVEQEITGIQTNLHIDRDGLKSAIAREGYKFEDYFQLMRTSLAKRQLIEREIRNKATVSDDDLKAEYNRSASVSKTFRGAFNIFMLKFVKKDFKSNALAKDEAQRALDAIHGGSTIEEIFKKSELGVSGGDLGFLSYSEMTPALQKEVQKLGPQKTSGIIEDSLSFMIVKIGAVKADADEGFDKEKEALRGKLLEKEYSHQIHLWMDRQRTLNYVKITAVKK